MKYMRRQALVRALALGALAATGGAVMAQADYPSKPVRIIVPQSPGSGTDLTARFIAERLSREWKQGVIVDNKPGAGIIVGTEAAAKSAPDGYTLFMGASAVYVTRFTTKNLNFDAVKDFRVMMGVNDALLAFVVPANSPANSIQDLVALGRTKKLNYGSAGVGSITSIAPALMGKMAGLELVELPYKGSGPVVTDVIGGQLDFAAPAIASVGPQVAAGKMKALAVTGPRRSKTLPNVPTMAESGFEGFDVTSKTYVAAPAGLPDAIADKIVASISRIIATPEYLRFLELQGLEPEPMSPKAYAGTPQEELRRWGKVTETIGMKAE